jgi:hypothetical protein
MLARRGFWMFRCLFARFLNDPIDFVWFLRFLCLALEILPFFSSLSIHFLVASAEAGAIASSSPSPDEAPLSWMWMLLDGPINVRSTGHCIAGGDPIDFNFHLVDLGFDFLFHLVDATCCASH